jgi:hypothetical protein
MPIISPVDLLPGGEIDGRRVPLLGVHDGETLSESPGLDELTSARVLGRLLYALAGASFKLSSRTLETSENTELLRRLMCNELQQEVGQLTYRSTQGIVEPLGAGVGRDLGRQASQQPLKGLRPVALQREEVLQLVDHPFY